VNSYRTIVVSILLGLALLFVGCGRGKAVQRLPVYGTVTLANGEKLNGSITFRPAKGSTGPAATTKLADGSYKFDRSNGPTAGSQTVIVKRVVSRSDALQLLGKKQPVTKTKTEWIQSAEVSDDGRYLHDFTLED